MSIPMGSVENERRFSSMNLAKTPLRNRLGTKHLNVALRIAGSEFPVESFPYAAAFKKWKAAYARRGTLL